MLSPRSGYRKPTSAAELADGGAVNALALPDQAVIGLAGRRRVRYIRQMLTLTDVWPLFALEITSPRLTMRIVRDEDIPGIVDAALAGIHDPAVMPFSVPWTDAPREQMTQSMAQFQWSLRTGVRRDHWTLDFVILLDGVPIGTQSIGAGNFSLTRTVTSGSWLTREHHGKGYGKEMRAAILLFAFDHLGAEIAESGATVWNQQSLGVSRSLGYQDNGLKRVPARAGETNEMLELRLDAADFIRPEWDITVAGLEHARGQLFGAKTTA